MAELNQREVFAERVEGLRQRVETAMQRLVGARINEGGDLADAVRYAIATEGKRIRPLLTYAAADLVGMSEEMADIPAAAIELVHVYSLVHDDLPAMDDDDLRRGQPTVHKAYDEATAILVGDALQTLGFEILSADEAVPPAVVVRWMQQLCAAAGPLGMIQGQATDLEGESRALNLEELEAMHLGKTGAMICASLQMPLAIQLTQEQPDENLASQLTRFGRHIGLAFQIRDDLLDVEGSTEQIGKPAGSDEDNAKSTFVSLMGLEPARTRMNQELEQAHKILDELGERADGLRWIADYIVQRNY